MTETRNKRIVAIVGRPNVGKSAIFNRLARRRVAIVHSQSGVTRDRLMREVDWETSRFTLIDTGGICDTERHAGRDEIERGIRAQAEAALVDASVCVLVVDVTAGVLPLDEAVSGLLRRSGCRVIVAVNKADHPGRDAETLDFERLGFPVFPVSALHDRGFAPMMEAVLAALPEVENATIGDPLKVAVVGRPNVGKSSYVNRLLRSDRVLVSDIPGTTRDSIDVPFVVGKGDQARHYLLIDTAGLRRKSKIDSSVETFSAFRAESSIKRADVVIIVVEAGQAPTAQDKKVASLVQCHQKGSVVLVNKWDLADVTQKAYGRSVAHALPFMAYSPLVFASAKTGYNVRRTIEAIDLVAGQVRQQLPTGVLNRTIMDAWDKVHPPAFKGKPVRFYYATQTGVAPVRIRMFVNRPAGVVAPYRQYLVRMLRSKFGLEGAPVIFQVRERTRPEGRDGVKRGRSARR